MVQPLLVPVSAGELLDKIAILAIKRERIHDAAQRAKQARFLLARGFSGEAVRRALAWDPDEDGAG